jgi:CheY-like chemotaxis protein
MTRSASAAGGPQFHTSAQRTLLTLLELACGATESALEAVRQAMVLAEREDLPLTGPEIVAFAHAHLVPVLSDQIGPRLTMALLDDLVAELGTDEADASGDAEASVPPPASIPRPIARMRPRPSSPRVKPKHSVVLVDADRVGRSGVARALLRAKWDVAAVDTAADLAATLHAGESIDLLLIDGHHPEAEAILAAVLRASPNAAVVVRSWDAARSRAQLAALGAARYDVRSHDAPTEELLEAARRALGP